tara:strand:- start:694 stop:1173 length:480 start_codon:yes stop_codon:yes gene_type:complete
MKKTLSLILFLFISYSTEAQVVISYEYAVANNISKDSLDSMYETATNYLGEGVFDKSEQQAFMKRYFDLHSKLAQYLFKKGLRWDRLIKVPFYTYVDSTGSFDHIIINLKFTDFNEVEKANFISWTADFIKENSTFIKASKSYRQCSTVPYAKIKYSEK